MYISRVLLLYATPFCEIFFKRRFEKQNRLKAKKKKNEITIQRDGFDDSTQKLIVVDNV